MNLIILFDLAYTWTGLFIYLLIYLNYRYRIRTRFCYSVSDNALLASEDVYKSYVSSCHSDNVVPTQPSVFGRHLVDAIPNVKKIKKRIPGTKNQYKYPSILNPLHSHCMIELHTFVDFILYTTWINPSWCNCS